MDYKQRTGKTPWWHIHQIIYAGSESLLEEPSNRGRNLRRTSTYLQNRGLEKSKIRRPLLRCQRPGDLLPTTMETTLYKEGKQTSHVSWHLGQGNRVLNELAQAMANRTLWCDIVSAISTAVHWWSTTSRWRNWKAIKTYTKIIRLILRQLKRMLCCIRLEITSF